MERVCSECIFDERLWKALPDPQNNTTCDRCKRKRRTTRLTAADRIREIRPPRPAKSIDWEGLKNEYFQQTDHQSVTAFLRSKGWSDGQCRAGNTTDNTLGWSQERAVFRRNAYESAREASKQAIVDLVPDIYEAKLRIIKRLMKRADTEEEIRDVLAILEALKTELGEPTRVSKSQITVSDEVEEAIKELRNVIKNTGREGEDNGGGPAEPTTATTAPDPS